MTRNECWFAAHEMDVRRRPISKNFHHVLRTTERQTLTGPPESMREHIVAASREMKKGDWRACCNFIVNDKMNAKVIRLSVCRMFVEIILILSFLLALTIFLSYISDQY